MTVTVSENFQVERARIEGLAVELSEFIGRVKVKRHSDEEFVTVEEERMLEDCWALLREMLG